MAAGERLAGRHAVRRRRCCRCSRHARSQKVTGKEARSCRACRWSIGPRGTRRHEGYKKNAPVRDNTHEGSCERRRRESGAVARPHPTKSFNTMAARANENRVIFRSSRAFGTEIPAAGAEIRTCPHCASIPHYRFVIGMYSRPAWPTYFWVGLKILLSAICSSQCASQPETRDMANTGVKQSCGIPIAL